MIRLGLEPLEARDGPAVLIVMDSPDLSTRGGTPQAVLHSDQIRPATGVGNPEDRAPAAGVGDPQIVPEVSTPHVGGMRGIIIDF